MKTSYYFFLLIILISLVSVSSLAQISNLVVNGSSTSFTMTTGDTIHWEYDISPAGATVNGELWYDVDGNGVIDPATDKPRFVFTQTDGNSSGNGGPPDMDGTVNGHVVFMQHVGLAPGKYVFKLSYNGTSHIVTGNCLALASPAHTISGKVTPPAGKSAQYIFVEVRRSGNYDPNFWDAVTDINGDYTIGMSSDTAGNPWSVILADQYNPFPPSLVSPSEIQLTISASSYTGNDFTFTQAAAQVAGYVRDDNGNPLLDVSVFVSRNDGGIYHQGRTGVGGFFQIGLLSGDLNGQTWRAQTGDNGSPTSTYLVGQATLPAINLNDSIPVNLVVYSTNAQIQGQVLVDGSPAGFPLQIFASNDDSAQAYAYSDGGTGNFTIPVSNKIYNYSVFASSLPVNWNGPSVPAHPGDNSVAVNITITSVRDRDPGIPAHFSLKQNYPNPFNPVTSIDYDVASLSHVRLIVFNILGQEVARIVDEMQQPGKYKATFDGSKLSSGVYFYTVQAGTFSKTLKLVLMK